MRLLVAIPRLYLMPVEVCLECSRLVGWEHWPSVRGGPRNLVPQRRLVVAPGVAPGLVAPEESMLVQLGLWS